MMGFIAASALLFAMTASIGGRAARQVLSEVFPPSDKTLHSLGDRLAAQIKERRSSHGRHPNSLREAGL
jgi:hypothetical protein